MFSSLPIDRAAFGVAWKCSAGSQHLPQFPMKPEIVEVFHANGRTVPMDEPDARKRSSAWTCRRNLRAERLYIDTLSYLLLVLSRFE